MTKKYKKEVNLQNKKWKSDIKFMYEQFKQNTEEQSILPVIGWPEQSVRKLAFDGLPWKT